MIELTRFNGEPFILNAELIETVEALPDTIITLFNGRKYMVREKVEEVLEKIITFKNRAYILSNSVSAAESIREKREKKYNSDCNC
ncbi:MAG TPA: flagellar FlbD family protein [Thermotogota bacterium]|nr:flagellar FlbD family protein [Thermotogota bacterium]HPJ89785.1 flagellar FlbD family protein [Thermotogota bacterium]HPR95733.1 flagellar FlbD family protein [Thermotogota bacterium]